jgi:hypothetical protein
MKISEKDRQRFWLKVDIKGEKECWQWLSGKQNNGYGVFWFNKKNIKSHRFAWISTFCEIPKGLYICHKCDNPGCVNPAHLFLGTPADNMKDKQNKGRAKGHTKKINIGENNPKAKLTEKDIISIRNDNRKQIIIAKEYGVHKTTISQIKNYKCWKNL